MTPANVPLSRRPLPLWLFALAAASPAVLLALGLWRGGVWPVLALGYMAVFTVTLDQIKPLFRGSAATEEFPGADGLLVGLALAHLALLPLLTFGIAGASGLGLGERIVLLLAGGLWFGQVSNPMAHELIHRGDKRLYRLGVAVYSTLLFGHHASAHRLVHHRHAASDADPNSARAGESFWEFYPRAWVGSFRTGWAAEDDLRARAGKAGLHPYAGYLGTSLAALILAALIAGPTGVVIWALLAAHAQVQLLLSDYVQHYGLRRRPLPDGRLEPVGDRHSWNAPFWFTSAMMLNAPRHSDHHAHPARPYPALRLPARDEAPMLPWPLPMACTMALFPRLWRARIAPHLARWSPE